MTTSLELSKKLAEAGLKIETEKWYNNQGLGHYHIGYFRPDMSEFPVYQTDELLAVMPDEIYAKDGEMGLLAMRKGEVRYDFPNGSKIECGLSLSEALGKMCLWLLDNGYKYEEKEKCLTLIQER